jgi:hypothetical protein
MKPMKTTRRQLLLGAGAAVMAHWPRSLSAAAWQAIAPGDAGFAADLEARRPRHVGGNPDIRRIAHFGRD